MRGFGQEISAEVPDEKAAEYYLKDLAKQNDATTEDIGDSVDIGEVSAFTGL